MAYGVYLWQYALQSRGLWSVSPVPYIHAAVGKVWLMALLVTLKYVLYKSYFNVWKSEKYVALYSKLWQVPDPVEFFTAIYLLYRIQFQGSSFTCPARRVPTPVRCSSGCRKLMIRLAKIINYLSSLVVKLRDARDKNPVCKNRNRNVIANSH